MAYIDVGSNLVNFLVLHIMISTIATTYSPCCIHVILILLYLHYLLLVVKSITVSFCAIIISQDGVGDEYLLKILGKTFLNKRVSTGVSAMRVVLRDACAYFFNC